ncbi:hypothetical protein KUV51_20640 [Tateyamaria omphalii]|uniref:hypothetical protein n=1 Tax=Tateyamaria omphalii TaxID=299262 RepID=UPI001C99AF77|nr:hypothetical protein [Tateyamaria omphalii]MBY5935427.1 hypothetical protein [Tateyamaria omphalii]
MVSTIATTLVILLVPFWAPTLVRTGQSPILTAAMRFCISALAIAAALLPIQLAFFPLGPIRLLPLELGFLWLGAAPFWVPFLAVRVIQLGLKDRAQINRKVEV